MDTKIDDATTARTTPIIEPRLLRAISIVEHQVYSENISQFTLPNEFSNALQPCGAPIGEINAKQAICGTGRVDYFCHLFSITAEWLLAEDSEAVL